MTDLTPEALAILAGGAPSPKGGRKQAIAAVALLTVVAAGGGAALGLMLMPAAVPPAAAPEAQAADAPAPAAGEPVQGKVVTLEPVLTTIAAPVGAQILLQASLVLDPAAAVDETTLATQVQADTVLFVRTLELAQLEGARGLLHLKEDLLERARLRSPAVTEVAVRSLVLR